MSHVGNDIVDLKTADARNKSKDNRFIQKVLTPEEQSAVFNSGSPDTVLWAHWAAKESAFKAVSKSSPNVISAPRRYPVIFEFEKSSHSATGMVMTPKGIVWVQIDFHDDYIHCIGIAGFTAGSTRFFKSIQYDVGKILVNPKTTPESLSPIESLTVRRLAKTRIAECLGMKKEDIKIIRHHIHHRINPPMVYAKGKKQNMDISLSHDGRFAAFAFLESPHHNLRNPEPNQSLNIAITF